jgi:hypothetical protein
MRLAPREHHDIAVLAPRERRDVVPRGIAAK